MALSAGSIIAKIRALLKMVSNIYNTRNNFGKA